jgi:hypothetical protein
MVLANPSEMAIKAASQTDGLTSLHINSPLPAIHKSWFCGGGWTAAALRHLRHAGQQASHFCILLRRQVNTCVSFKFIGQVALISSQRVELISSQRVEFITKS